jgi:hypothetical protein
MENGGQSLNIFREKGFDHDAEPANMMGITLLSGLGGSLPGVADWVCGVEIRAEEGYAA